MAQGTVDHGNSLKYWSNGTVCCLGDHPVLHWLWALLRKAEWEKSPAVLVTRVQLQLSHSRHVHLHHHSAEVNHHSSLKQ